MKKEDILQTLSYLALKMENSGTRILEAIAPQTLVHMPKKFTRESHRFGFEDEPDISPQEVENVVERIKCFAKFLSINPVQASLMVWLSAVSSRTPPSNGMMSGSFLK